MRVTGNQIIEAAAAATSRAQEHVSETGSQVSSGLRVDTPSDDPSAWLSAHREMARRALIEGAGNAVKTSRDRLDETDTALAQLGDSVSEIRSLAIQGSNATLNPADRAALGIQARGLFQAALTAVNVRSSQGEFLLGGSVTTTAPFDAAGVYHGDAGVRSVPTLDGATAFATVPGSDLTAAAPGGVDVLPLLDRVATALSTNDTATLATSLDQLDAAVKQVSLARARTGSTGAVLDATTTAHDQLRDQLTGTIARHIEIDTVAAASELAKATQALEVSRAVTSHVLQLLDPST